MAELADIAPQFVEIAHKIVWCSVATIDRRQRPRSRILHPYWEWDSGAQTLVAWIATAPTPIKRAHLGNSPYVSGSYWAPTQDVAVGECRAQLVLDDAIRTRVWNLYKDAPPPLGYDLPGEVFLNGGSGGAITWSE